MLIRNPHRPAHLLLDDQPYFLTGAIHRGRRLIADDIKDRIKAIFAECLQSAGWGLQHWVLLDNHYHLIAVSRRGTDLPGMVRTMHSRSGYLIRQRTRCESPVWSNYWDYSLRDERDYYTHLNYLLYNPVKHGYVEDLRDWAWSSFPSLLEVSGRARLVEQFEAYPQFRALDLEDNF